jgi:hypothetical protein
MCKLKCADRSQKLLERGGEREVKRVRERERGGERGREIMKVFGNYSQNNTKKHFSH